MIRSINIAHQLSNLGQVTVLAVSQRFDEGSVKLVEKEFENVIYVKLRDYPSYGDLLGRFMRKFHMHWPWSKGVAAKDLDQELFMELVTEHDIVWLHTLAAANPFRFKKRPRFVMDMDDLNHCKFALSSVQNEIFRYKLSAKIQSFKWKRHELDALKQYEKIIVCSQTDKELLGGGEKIYVVPNGFMRPETKPQWNQPDEFRLGFIGALNYGPNSSGLIWFRDHVWPLIKEQKPNMTLRIVGTTPSKKYLVEADGFELLGYVDDPTAEFKTWSAMITPIQYGGGTRIKIIEAFSKMCPVVSTRVGAHGIETAHGKNIFLADEPADFARYCLELSDSPEKGRQMAEAGWQLFLEKYSWDVIGESIKTIIEKIRE
ncbi:MAG: glycosyltransferase family 4 protein [Planctomycetota bacterium]|jgi:glycosyltransferase involved in cell wall biosynthesis